MISFRWHPNVPLGCRFVIFNMGTSEISANVAMLKMMDLQLGDITLFTNDWGLFSPKFGEGDIMVTQAKSVENNGELVSHFVTFKAS